MAKLPSMQFYPGDWRKDPGVQALNYEERGIWFEMILLMFESGTRGKLVLNGKKMSDEALAQTLGLLKQKSNQIVSKIIDYGVAKVEPDTGIIFCSRMVKDENLRKTRQAAGKQGGNPILLKQTSTTGVKQNTTPSSSTSSSTSLKDKKTCRKFDKFSTAWEAYPNKDGKKLSQGYYRSSVKNQTDHDRLMSAMQKYKKSVEQRPRDWKNGATFFNNWLDWEKWEEPAKPGSNGTGKIMGINGDEFDPKTETDPALLEGNKYE